MGPESKMPYSTEYKKEQIRIELDKIKANRMTKTNNTKTKDYGGNSWNKHYEQPANGEQILNSKKQTIRNGSQKFINNFWNFITI